MQDITSIVDPRMTNEPQTGNGEEAEEKFVPKGAITFFLLMLVIYAGMWFVMYFDLLRRN